MSQDTFEQFSQDHPHPVILFDGVCNLCHSSVQFMIPRDPQRKLRYASLQSEFGQWALKKLNMPLEDLDTMVLIENGKAYRKSSAALLVSRHLKGIWKLLYIFIILPPFIRNPVYNFIAKNRYRWFGKQETCWIPTPEIKELFLEAAPLRKDGTVATKM